MLGGRPSAALWSEAYDVAGGTYLVDTDRLISD